jgi:peptide/nickel transport system permease protein
MAKMTTPAIEAMKTKRSTNKKGQSSMWKDALRRLMRNKAAMVGLGVIVVILICALIPQVIAPYGFDDQNYANKFLFPSLKHPLGTDQFGRDILSRMIYGSRVSMQVGLISVTCSAITGGLLGALAAFYGKYIENGIMRFIDILLAIPSTLMAISIAAALGPGLYNMMVAISIGSVPSYARIVRASMLTVKEQEYIEAAKAVGASDMRIMFRHMLPNSIAPVIVQATLGMAGAILSAASLSFIGLGIQPPTPEWGAMLSGGRQYIREYWHIVTFPGLMIMITIFALNLFGDGLRDALDPRLKR